MHSTLIYELLLPALCQTVYKTETITWLLFHHKEQVCAKYRDALRIKEESQTALLHSFYLFS